MSRKATLKIATRGSPLALWQAREVRRRLLACHADLAEDGVEIVTIRTSGDRIQDRTLADAGGKGLFTKEIEEALLAGAIDLAVHSMKDVATVLPTGLAIGAILAREDPRDAFLSPAALGLAGLPAGAVVGTSSLRRQAQVLNRRPDLKVVTYRGNVETRLRKLAAGEVDATLLAQAGLKRLGLADRATALIEPEEMLPAVAQGAIGIEIRAGDDAVRTRLVALDDPDSALRVAAERAFLAELDGSCRTPIAGLAVLSAEGDLWLRAEILRPDGSERHTAERTGACVDAEALGRDAGRELKARASADFFV